MKFKYYLRGCGLGILFASIILMISFRTKGTMDDRTVMERASELGMVMPEDTSQLPEQESQNAGKPVESDSSEIQKTTEQDSQKKANDGAGEEKKQPETEDKKPSGKPKKVSITIKKGEVCRELAEDLQGKGLIEDAGEFQSFMREKGYDEKISVGTFELLPGMTYEEIAKQITFRDETK